MVISFETAELRELCEDEAAAQKEFGLDAEQLLAVLADLNAAPTLEDLPPGLVSLIVGIADNYRIKYGNISLAFSLNHKKIPRNERGNVKKGKVTRVKVVEVYHHD